MTSIHSPLNLTTPKLAQMLETCTGVDKGYFRALGTQLRGIGCWPRNGLAGRGGPKLSLCDVATACIATAALFPQNLYSTAGRSIFKNILNQTNEEGRKTLIIDVANVFYAAGSAFWELKIFPRSPLIQLCIAKDGLSERILVRQYGTLLLDTNFRDAAFNRQRTFPLTPVSVALAEHRDFAK